MTENSRGVQTPEALRAERERVLAEKHLQLAHTRLGQIAFTAAQEGKHETAKVYRAAQSVVADEIGFYRMALAALPQTPEALRTEDADLLEQHAALLELLAECDTELDDLTRRVRMLAEDAPDDCTTDADELRRKIAVLREAK